SATSTTRIPPCRGRPPSGAASVFCRSSATTPSTAICLRASARPSSVRTRPERCSSAGSPASPAPPSAGDRFPLGARRTMKPAFSIIFFTVGSGAGLGLLALAALFDLVSPDALSSQTLWRSALFALILIAASLASSTMHLANPKNAWRSLARVRTSWLSREAAFALALFPVAGLYLVLAAKGNTGPARAVLALASVLLAWAVLFCTAMIYASLKPIRQWHTWWTP